MSRNKDIAFVHKVTGQPYRVCRARMKKCNWNIAKVIFWDSEFSVLTKSFALLKPAIADLCDSFGDLCHNIGDACYLTAENLREDKI